MSNFSHSKVVYLYDQDVGKYHYGHKHPMKPHRISLTNALIVSYGLHEMMQIVVPSKASTFDMNTFHSPEYIRMLNDPDQNSDDWQQYQHGCLSSSISSCSTDSDSSVSCMDSVVENHSFLSRDNNTSSTLVDTANLTANDTNRWCAISSAGNYNIVRYSNCTPKLLNTNDIYHNKTSNNRTLPQINVDYTYLALMLDSKSTKPKSLGDNFDCPIFHGLIDFCSRYTGASLTGAELLNAGKCDIAINWSGGLHHARKSEASGFCYVNDIVISIQKLLKCNKRILYIDIDVHHGDGVEHAFLYTDRVMTLSFHHYDGHYFPQTGHMYDIGEGEGKFYCINVPIRSGISDMRYRSLFQPIVHDTISCFKPNVIVLQCGADSLAGDKLGRFNLSIKEHAECVKFVTKFNLPMLVLGGGGYTIKNVSRCWAYETACILGEEDNLPSTIPENDYIESFRPDYNPVPKLSSSRMQDLNSDKYIMAIRQYINENLQQIHRNPST
ncbi:hypothetical protein GJ496_010150 [Pomphorhynchus laevis]|nr:hypothetical protein GJ496_010150 [Pomphorhynchus laevis]